MNLHAQFLVNVHTRLLTAFRNVLGVVSLPDDAWIYYANGDLQHVCDFRA